MKKRAISTIGHLCVLAAAALALGLFLLPGGQHGGINSFEGAKFKDMVGGTAPKPYVHRALLPQTIHAISAVTPDRLELGATERVESHRAARDAFANLGWETGLAFQYLVAALLMYLCFVGFGYSCAGLVGVVGETHRAGRAGPFLAALALYGLTPFFIYGSHLNDPPQLLLFAASLYFLSKMAIRRFLFLFALAALNKETAILMVPIFAVFCRPLLPRHRYVSVLLLLCSVYLAIKATLFAVFHGNPGALVELRLLDHSLVPKTWVKVYARTPYFAVLLAAALLWWNHKPRFLKIAFLSTLPPLVLLAFLFGYVDEWRVYYEAYPVVFALAVDSVRRASLPPAPCRV